MAFHLQDFPAPTRDSLVERVGMALAASPFRKASRWPHAVVFDGDAPRVSSRADFASYLRAAGLDAQAHEATRRRIPPGHVLVWVERDNAKVATAGFILVDFASELAAWRTRNVT